MPAIAVVSVIFLFAALGFCIAAVILALRGSTQTPPSSHAFSVGENTSLTVSASAPDAIDRMFLFSISADRPENPTCWEVCRQTGDRTAEKRYDNLLPGKTYYVRAKTVNLITGHETHLPAKALERVA